MTYLMQPQLLCTSLSMSSRLYVHNTHKKPNPPAGPGAPLGALGGSPLEEHSGCS